MPDLALLRDPALLAGGLLLIGLLLLRRRWREDAHLLRQTAVVGGLLGLFVLLRTWLSGLAPTTERLVRIPETGELVPTLAPGPLFQTVSVASLVVGLLAALLLVSLVVVDLFLVRRLKVEIPNILPNVAALTVFFFGVLLILYHTTDLDITAVFTTSAVLSVVIGLALQDTLGNLFSGLALQTESPFRVGDWVSFGEHEGAVIDVTWRSTKIRTRDNDLLVIPNGVIASGALVNYSSPSRAHAVSSTVGCHYRHPPAEVFAALEEAAAQTEGILPSPRPKARLVEYGDSHVLYQLRYWIREYAGGPDIRSSLMVRIWYVFSRRGIEIPYPIRTLFRQEPGRASDEPADEAALARRRSRLERCDLFRPLTGAELDGLARQARLVRFFTGETVLRQGEPGDSLYLIDEGRVEVLLEREGTRERVAELGPPAFFGEMSLMTGEPRSATVRALEASRFVVVERDAMGTVLERNPDIATHISATLADRTRELAATRAAAAEDGADGGDTDRQQLLSRIRHFFGF